MLLLLVDRFGSTHNSSRNENEINRVLYNDNRYGFQDILSNHDDKLCRLVLLTTICMQVKIISLLIMQLE